GRLGAPARARGIRIAGAFAADAFVDGDRSGLARTAVALVHNAVRYAQRGIEVRVAHGDGSVEFAVVDDGPGFTAAALAHGTERFWRDDEARGRDGSGLGLALARAIVEGHRGSLSLANGSAGGAIVRVSLPAAD
ncbi:MAG: sensor histidine kinase, partial [Vulcanimicrobiaceae bacterium]